MSVVASKDYINLIISYLKDDSKIPQNEMNEETKEWKIDIFSDNLFEQLYHNLLLFYKLNRMKNIGNKLQKYFFEEIVNILDIIYEEDSNIFFQFYFLKAILIYLIYSLKNSINVNPEIVLKIFFGFEDVLDNIFNNRVINELHSFEKEIIEMIKKLISIYYMDSNIYLDIEKCEDNFLEIVKHLKILRNKIPIYFHGFIDYKSQPNYKKFLIMKIYRYFQKLNPYLDEKNILLYQGYSLYGIVSYKNISKIAFDEFRSIQSKRIINNDAKSILKLTAKFLQLKKFQDFLTELRKENFDFSSETSKVLDIFDETEKYYKDIYNQLKYYFSQYKEPENYKVCEIYSNNYSRILWLNFSKLLLLNLSENDIYRSNIKIIFYFIVNLFNPEIDTSSLEFRKDAIPKLFSQSLTSTEILDNPEIYRIIDIDYSQYYPESDKENNFTQTFINMINKKSLKKLKDAIFEMPTGNQIEIENIKKHNLILPFPLLQDYLSNLKKNTNKNSLAFENIYNFYRYCFLDFEASDQENFIGNIKNIESPADLIEDRTIKTILSNTSFLDLIKKIMKSPVMKDAYTRIFYYYATNGEFEIDQEILPKIIKTSKNNLINDKSIYDYYTEFCEKLKEINYSKLFIVMSLPESIKGFTFRFLKIVINYEGIQFETANNEDIDKTIMLTLLQAYLVFVVIHELNHYMKRFLNKNKSFKICKTPEIKEYKEGGEQLIKLLFGHILIHNSLNFKQAKFILNEVNWNKNSVCEFRRSFLSIETNCQKDKCIVYLSSKKNSICDHSKLFG